MEVHELQFAHRRVCIYRRTDASVPIVYSIDYHENGRLLMDAFKQVGCEQYNLVTVSGLDWNQELSPWPAGTVVSKDDSFTGQAEPWLSLLTGDVVPQVERTLAVRPAWRCLAGYSMAGLFALWAAHHTDLFSGIVSASGSMWYPGWMEYVQEHRLSPGVTAVYLSVGDKESTSRNAVLQTVGARTQAVAAAIERQAVRVMFEFNPGNHFKNPPLRVAKGVKWLTDMINHVDSK